MAIAKTQSTGKFRGTGVTSIAGSFGGLPTEGDLIAVIAWGKNFEAWEGQDCTDNQGNTYSLVGTVLQGPTQIGIWWAQTVAPSGTFTVTIARQGSFTAVGSAVAYSPDSAGQVWRPNERKFAIGTSTTPATGSSGTLAYADQVVVAACTNHTNDQASITVDAVSPTWDEDAEELSYATYVPGEANSRVVAATTAQSAGWTLATSSAWAAILVTFAPVTP